MLKYSVLSRESLVSMLEAKSRRIKELEDKIESIHADEYVRSVDDGMEIRRLRRCLVKMTKLWLKTKKNMYDTVSEISDWPLSDEMCLDQAVTERQLSNIDKILEKWR